MKPLHINFLTTTNVSNGYGMTREYFKRYLPTRDIILSDKDAGNDITLVLHIPPAMQHAKGKIKVLYTMIEGDELPDSWRKYLDMADHILVPSNFVKQTFEKAGYKTTVMPLGYDSQVFRMASRQQNKVFTFLHYEAFQDRKGWEDLLDAWLLSGLAESEFTVRLLLKTIIPFDKVYKVLEEKKITLPYNVSVISGELPHDCLNSILSTADCFVFPSRGEGFSLPPLEALATGCPVIISKGHSHMDYFDNKYMLGVEANKKIPARYSNWEDQGNFVRCDVDDLARALRYAYDNQQEVYQMGLAGVEYVQKYSYDKVIKKLADFIWQL